MPLADVAPREGLIVDSAVAQKFSKETPGALELISLRPRHWEHLLTVELLASRLEEIRSTLGDLQTFERAPPPRQVSAADFSHWGASVADLIPALAQRMKPVFDSDLAAAWGPVGRPGDPAKILETVNKLASFCALLTGLQRDLLSQVPPEPLLSVRQHLKCMITIWIRNYVSVLEQLAGGLRAAGDGAGLLTLTMNWDEAVPHAEAIALELDRLAERAQSEPGNPGPNAAIAGRSCETATGDSFLLGELLAELHSLVGLDAVKQDVVELVNFLRVQHMRQAHGLPRSVVSLHSVFYGNPGTGKTTVARLLSKIYKSLGILKKGHLVETDRAGLVAGYVGQTALKVTEVVDQALGGVLFVDEAYSLAGEGSDYGREAIETLLKLMEDRRDELIVIVAGYTHRMDTFLSSNPGLRSRFGKSFRFIDYDPAQLLSIFERFLRKDGYRLTPQARERLTLLFLAAHARRDEAFGNARFARTIFERTISAQANRIMTMSNVSPETLASIEAEDILANVDDIQFQRLQ